MSRCSICECKTMNCVCDPYDKGYAEGIADERKRLLGDGKPDGWIAYSARHGYDKMSFRAKESLVAEHMSDTKLAPDLHPLDMGWQIKPVKLVVLDEEE